MFKLQRSSTIYLLFILISFYILPKFMGLMPLAFLILYFILPIITFIVSFIYGIRNGFNIIFPIIIFILSFICLFSYGQFSMFSLCFIYGIISFIGIISSISLNLFCKNINNILKNK